MKAFDCVEVVPKGELEVGAQNAGGQAAGAPNGDAGAAPKDPAGFPNAPGLFPPQNAPPPPKPPENGMLTRTLPDEFAAGVAPKIPGGALLAAMYSGVRPSLSASLTSAPLLDQRG